MHCHLEIIMPPTDDVEASVSKVLEQFDENNECEYARLVAFWDFWVIGGRWAGEKLKAKFDPEQIKKFYAALKEKNVTVSALQCGKQEIQPASQIPMVDELWREFFPDGGEVCPLFSHYNDQYKHSGGYPDVMQLKDMPAQLSAARVIIAAPDNNGNFEAIFMTQDDFWNGVIHVKSDWDGKVQSAIDQHTKRLTFYTEEAKLRYTPQPDWLLVTVDYHS